MNERYFQMEINGDKMYIKTDSMDKLKEVDAIIFDCDGVLIDIRESYNKTISKTVTMIIKELTGIRFPENLVSKEVIHLFKKSGGFNNDWDLTYAILLCIFCKLPKEYQEVFEKHVKVHWSEKDLFKRFLLVRDSVRKEYTAESLDNGMDAIRDMLKQLAINSDPSGIMQIEKKLTKLLGNTHAMSINNVYAAVKRFLSYPGSVGESLLTSVFEEIFCGPQLFRKIYNQEPRFYKEQGLIENERLIITPNTFNQLFSILDKTNFGIASGRSFHLAKYTLNGLLEKFNPEALVFLDDINASEREVEKKEGLEVNLKKPNPFSLIKSSKGLKPFKFALYVGDSAEDMFMVKAANKLDSRFSFVGVYYYSDYKNDVLNNFLKAEVDAILPSVNDLPTILRVIKKR